ncbi:similar to Saccharomyces cerevisiae YDR007W TRP1 Phosphoribosylanthranilate isomerase that catalyzes the third step in tryptophan biosynthesis [Maudiozyma barnettii]|uniref:N-(5'-phosphoribosyl)anthranilate isomerase n=1 Tax=Maudiozyma barnettii TaxID=61262 RepID=A0A8H2VGJ6_9SACH|nr:phosphoribosylanthranilate isomerase TRP1 [Kazachstania barnettii]CAB4255251.1 similar to Saccharomyces cerevisiae YDR007W TRP1 Phosphoribosylanthranilate isomerase that catalyzes the third step in tryptophan biosynthesis [Kazachstania barnettii]CAD1783658.1 similar to Saccharomyces cerevisiae YDR007W TRP1 Phosphoribosylanthranilate isomerase that catalyzes the third step in tryptophan biosynthesis [Kazachstania barnettii]
MDLQRFNTVVSRVPDKSIVKICGLQTIDAAKCALDSGANLIGIICVPNRKRTIEPSIAKQISTLVHTTSEYSDRCLVGVFRNQSKEDVLKLATDYNVDIVQLHGDEDWEEYQRFINKPVIKRVIFPRDRDEVIRISQMDTKTCLPLFDSEAGGTGEILDWQSISNWSKDIQAKDEINIEYILAGGLTAENVHDAVTLHGVIGVDVSGGVETDGVKDFTKIANFVKNGQL